MTRPIPLILKPTDWPEADRKPWDACFSKGHFFTPAGPFAGWSPGTRQFHAQGLGEWLSFLARQMPGLLELPPDQRVTLGTVEAYIDETRMRISCRSLANKLFSLFIVIRGFAPDQDWEWLLHHARYYDASLRCASSEAAASDH